MTSAKNTATPAPLSWLSQTEENTKGLKHEKGQTKPIKNIYIYIFYCIMVSKKN